jgi:hypothetical protein
MGHTPGMSWKHELHRETADGSAPVQTNPLGNGNHETGKAHIIARYGAPLKEKFGHPVTNYLERGVSMRNHSSAESRYR